MEKVVLFLDYANINRGAKEKRFRMDYQDFLEYVGEDRFLVDAHCYVPINPRNEHRSDGIIQDLWRAGYIVTTKVGTIAGGTYKCNFDVEITMDMLKVVYQVKPDIIVLASGDSDFLSLIQEVRKSGIRVEVAAFEETAGADIMSKCSGFIDLEVYYDGYLASLNGEQVGDSVDEQFKDLIQLQNGENIADQHKELIPTQSVDPNADTVKLPVRPVEELIPDITDELGL
jgi:uncharacterized LabA/DUF88 family protein